jgi:hypothetical protein
MHALCCHPVSFMCWCGMVSCSCCGLNCYVSDWCLLSNAEQGYPSCLQCRQYRFTAAFAMCFDPGLFLVLDQVAGAGGYQGTMLCQGMPQRWQQSEGVVSLSILQGVVCSWCGYVCPDVCRVLESRDCLLSVSGLTHVYSWLPLWCVASAV